MKSFVVVLALVALAAADVSHIVPKSEANAPIEGQDSDVRPDGFKYGYKTGNGIEAQESGDLVQVDKELGIAVQGSYSYTAPDGTPVLVRYIADATGFHPESNLLPTTPAPQPIPDYILKSLQYIASHPPKEEVLRKF